uniref:CHAD domain containing protein n=1 Tax=Rhodopseudomonas palustris (strain BisA53) TaxID=316055 RepID=Q07HL0_RHOP5
MGKAATGAARRKAGQGRPAAARDQFRATAATAASKAEKVVLPDGVATAEAFRIVAGSVLRQILSNQPAVAAANPDGVHQMRIGLRRMRAAISIFAELLQDDETLRLKQELRWLTGRLGPARDLHLLARQIRRSRSRDPGRQSQLAGVELRRAKAFLGAKRAVASSRYRYLLRDLARWIEAGDWAANPTLDDSLRGAADFADRVIAKRARKVLRRATELRELDVAQRHRLRIAAKKLYYATGFFETLFTGRGSRNRLATFQLKLKSLLDELGALNDIAVQQQLTGSFARAVGSRSRSNGAAPLRRDREIDRLLDSADRAGRELAEAKRFWT